MPLRGSVDKCPQTGVLYVEEGQYSCSLLSYSLTDNTDRFWLFASLIAFASALSTLCDHRVVFNAI